MAAVFVVVAAGGGIDGRGCSSPVANGCLPRLSRNRLAAADLSFGHKICKEIRPFARRRLARPVSCQDKQGNASPTWKWAANGQCTIWYRAPYLISSICSGSGDETTLAAHDILHGWPVNIYCVTHLQYNLMYLCSH